MSEMSEELLKAAADAINAMSHVAMFDQAPNAIYMDEETFWALRQNPEERKIVENERRSDEILRRKQLGFGQVSHTKSVKQMKRKNKR